MSGSLLQNITLEKSDNITVWDFRFFQLCDTVASWSKDPSRKVGSCIVDSRKRVVSVGYNGFPAGVEDLDSRYRDRETKLLFVCHAERNALDSSAVSVEGATLYCTLFPCNECVKSIIQRGIKRVVTISPNNPRDLLFNFKVSRIMLSEAKIQVSEYFYDDYERWKNGLHKGVYPLAAQE
jgi:dCMP deaminase